MNVLPTFPPSLKKIYAEYMRVWDESELDRMPSTPRALNELPDGSVIPIELKSIKVTQFLFFRRPDLDYFYKQCSLAGVRLCQ
jgi:hypothetical protein